MKEEVENLKVELAVHGIDPNKVIKDGSKKKSSGKSSSIPFQFGDPKEYENLTIEEREELTKKMMGSHQREFTKMKLSTPIG